MKLSEFRNEQIQLDEGPCDVAGKSDIEKMTGEQYVKYTNWKKECEEMEKRNPTSDDEAKLDKMVDEDGRPRGGAHIENERFWDLPDDQLHYIIKDASAAVQENPTAGKATQGPGNWSDQINDAATVLTYRKNKRLKAEETDESSPAPDGPDYKQGDLVVMPNGRSYTLDEYDDGIWWAVDNDGGDIEFEPGTELHHEPMSESEEDNVSGALDTMRQHFHDYNHDPSDRWEKYKQYRDQRKQISKRAKDLK